MSTEHTVTSVAAMSVQLDETLKDLARAQVREARLGQEIDMLRKERSALVLRADDASERANMLQALLETVSSSIVMGLQRYARQHSAEIKAKQEARLGVGDNDPPPVARYRDQATDDADQRERDADQSYAAHEAARGRGKPVGVPVRRSAHLGGGRPDVDGDARAGARIDDLDTGKSWEFFAGIGWTAVGGMVQGDFPERPAITREVRNDITDTRLPSVDFSPTPAEHDVANLRDLADRIAPAPRVLR